MAIVAFVSASAPPARSRALRSRKFLRNASASLFLRSSAGVGCLLPALFVDSAAATSSSPIVRCDFSGQCPNTAMHHEKAQENRQPTTNPALALIACLWQKPPRCCGSSVVEHIIGNDEVGSSILPRSTIFSRCSSYLTNTLQFGASQAALHFLWNSSLYIAATCKIGVCRSVASFRSLPVKRVQCDRRRNHVRHRKWILFFCEADVVSDGSLNLPASQPGRIDFGFADLLRFCRKRIAIDQHHIGKLAWLQ